MFRSCGLNFIDYDESDNPGVGAVELDGTAESVAGLVPKVHVELVGR